MTSTDVGAEAKAVVRRNTEQVQSKGDFALLEELFEALDDRSELLQVLRHLGEVDPQIRRIGDGLVRELAQPLQQFLPSPGRLRGRDQGRPVDRLVTERVTDEIEDLDACQRDVGRLVGLGRGDASAHRTDAAAATSGIGHIAIVPIDAVVTL